MAPQNFAVPTTWPVSAFRINRHVVKANLFFFTVQTNDTFTGTMNAQYYDSNGTVIAAFKGTTTGTRIAVETEQP